MKGSGIPVPVDRRYFEDYVPGSIVEAGSVMLGEADILGFAVVLIRNTYTLMLERPRTGPLAV
jgi:hypothetical protein